MCGVAKLAGAKKKTHINHFLIRRLADMPTECALTGALPSAASMSTPNSILARLKRPSITLGSEK